ncbi:hypothetical protein HID58_045842 [Brassica napus]|uniref:Uncharacterized protein n=1 Tax=Brassica napus TaxID=3708 RepID=A0ABQ8AUQ3_BRANA|nr:hypothetical protein HID58_045842 [Brassica napus]
MESRGVPFRSILAHSLWITLVGILLFTLSTTKRHNFGYIKFFSARGYNLMWIVRSPKPSNENHLTNVVTISSSSSPLPSGQALKKGDTAVSGKLSP